MTSALYLLPIVGILIRSATATMTRVRVRNGRGCAQRNHVCLACVTLYDCCCRSVRVVAQSLAKVIVMG